MKKNSFLVYLFIVILLTFGMMMFLFYCNNMATSDYPKIGGVATTVGGTTTTVIGGTTTTVIGGTTTTVIGGTTTTVIGGTTTTVIGGTTTTYGGSYYSAFITAHGSETGSTFKASLHTLISAGASSPPYNSLDTTTYYGSVFQNLNGCTGGEVMDFYSNLCWNVTTQSCGSYNSEGDCYNKEHSWPKSWWGGGSGTQYSDMFHVVPTDGYVNNRRSNYPFGTNNGGTYVSNEGFKVGSCTYPGYTGVCFEPVGQLKGFFARSHFYMCVRYQNSISVDATATNWLETSPDAPSLKGWYEQMLKSWHDSYPPNAMETTINDRIYAIQNNRNPFIDHPEWVAKIYSATNGQGF